jgi:HD-like signal output (HDOD) protein/CheY-like chemotaxis protein
MQQILFVDDEQRLLDGLSRLLRPCRDVWDMTFALGGAEAIRQLETGQFDVVVCDMRMAIVDGLAVLRFARDRSPRTVRIALSGQTDFDVMSHSLSVVHQFLSKPCSPSILRSAIERACSLKSVLEDPDLQDVVGRLVDLPVLPRVYQEFTAAIDDPNAAIGDIVKIVEQDVALSARCLQVANSAYFGLRRRVETLGQAVTYLGISTLRAMVLSSAVFSSYRAGGRPTHAELEQLERHSVLVANIARQIPDDDAQRQQAFMAGMLHDIGRLVLATLDADPLASMNQARPADRELITVEGAHAGVGAYLIGIWGLPLPIVEAVAFHHQPERTSSTGGDVLSAVYIANELVREMSHPDASADGVSPSGLVAYLESIGRADRLPELRAIAASVIGVSGE